jgi:hypothetical protein
MRDETRQEISAAYAKDYTDWMVKTGGYAKDMTLRDHFAGLAIHGMMASGNLPKSVSDEELADVAYMAADAMLKERTK